MLFMLFVCEIMLLAAFLCDLCVICERIITQEDSNYLWGTLALSFCFYASFLVLSILFPCSFLMCLNGRSRVSRGNKMQKRRKFRASEYRVKFTWTMLSAAEILYQKKFAWVIRLSFKKRLQETHLKVPGKASRKFHSRNFLVVFSWHL